MPLLRQGILAPTVGIAILVPVILSLKQQQPRDPALVALQAVMVVACLLLAHAAIKSGTYATQTADCLSVWFWGVRRKHSLSGVQAVAVVPVQRIVQKPTVMVGLAGSGRTTLELVNDQAGSFACDALIRSCVNATVLDLRHGDWYSPPSGTNANASRRLARRLCCRAAMGNAMACTANALIGAFAWHKDSYLVAAMALTVMIAYGAKGIAYCSFGRRLGGNHGAKS
jgi:hypothetical protein